MHDVTQTLDAIKREFDSQNARIIYLQNQNKKLKEEHYKDTELQKMKEELERVRADMYRGFPISAEQEQRIKEWQDKHDAEVHGLKTLKERVHAGGCIGGRYSYEFVSTSIGVIGTAKCNCGAKFTFQDL
ncbi:hypothetical protein DW953_04800 [Ruminococcus sp. AM45-2]|nr:hypothetical protein DW953_04800 [Ruminococcus sp. AM45-2]